MNQNSTTPAESRITFAEVLKMFRGKVKFLVLITLVAAIVGGAVGALLTFSEVSYGGTVKFYLTTKDGSQALLPLLNSDSFSEKLLLDENGLPPKSECDPEDYEAALAAIEAYKEAVQIKRDLVKKSSFITSEYTVMDTKYKGLLEEYLNRFEELNMYLSAQDEIAKGENYTQKIAAYESSLEEARVALENFRPVYLEKMVEKANNADAIVKAKNDVIDKRYIAQDATEKVLAPWRERTDIKKLVTTISDSVSYEYAKLVEDVSAGTVAESEDNQNAAFLVITVDVIKDKETAEMIIEKLKARIPYFVEDNIERLTGANDPHCTLISTFGEICQTGGLGIVKTTATYAAVVAILVLALSCFIVVVKGLLPSDTFVKKEKRSKKNKATTNA